MANYQTSAAAIIPTQTKREQDFVLRRLHSDPGPSIVRALKKEGLQWEGPAADEIEAQADFGIYLYSYECLDVDRIIWVVAEWQRHFEITQAWSMEWANTCDKGRLGAFGGGAAIVYLGNVEWLNTTLWVMNKAHELGVSLDGVTCG